MSQGLPPNVIDSITFRGVGSFLLHLPTLHYHTFVVIYRLIACTILVPVSGASNELVIHEQRSSNGGVAVAQVVLGDGDGGSW